MILRSLLLAGAAETRGAGLDAFEAAARTLDTTTFATEETRRLGRDLAAARATETRTALDALRRDRHDPLGLEIRRALTALTDSTAQSSPATAFALARAQEDLMLARLREARLADDARRTAETGAAMTADAERTRGQAGEVQAALEAFLREARR